MSKVLFHDKYLNNFVLLLLAEEAVTGVHAVPSNYAQMKENVERVLHFMSSKRIRMHHVSAKGNNT